MCCAEMFPGMKVILIFSFSFIRHSQTAIHIQKMVSPINAILGQNLTISCFVTQNDKQELDLDLSNVGLRWSKRSSDGSESNVYIFVNHGHEQYRAGSFIDERELKRGDASLTLQDVQKSDEGVYTCTVIVTPYKASATIGVQLLAKPKVSLSSSQVIIKPGNEKNVTCKVTQFYPEAVQIHWVKYKKGSYIGLPVDRDIYFTGPEENSDGTFNVTSQLTVRASSLEEDGDVYSCTVTHISFSHKTFIFTLTMKESPAEDKMLLGISVSMIIILIIIIIILILIVSLKYNSQKRLQPSSPRFLGDVGAFVGPGRRSGKFK